MTLSTIHRVKGGEADNVVLCTDLSRKCAVRWQELDDSEIRVLYVAQTRARKNLYYQFSGTPLHYVGIVRCL